MYPAFLAAPKRGQKRPISDVVLIPANLPVDTPASAILPNSFDCSLLRRRLRSSDKRCFNERGDEGRQRPIQPILRILSTKPATLEIVAIGNDRYLTSH